MDEQLNIEHDSIFIFRMEGAALEPEDRFVQSHGAPQPSTRPVTVRRFGLLLFIDMFNSIQAFCDRNEIIQVLEIARQIHVGLGLEVHSRGYCW
jgi:hypothetical protein